MSIANNIRRLRKSRGLSQALLAEKLGTIQKVITDYETEKSKPPTDRLVRLAKFFKVSVDEIIGTKDVSLPANDEKLQHGNSRIVQLVKLFEKLSDEEQRTTLKQIKALVALKNRN
jgi:transcriptional regulator with XRE-family HTH domain